MLFTEFSLDDRLQRALATAEFVTPTPIQAAALPVALTGRDLVGTAQTGTGKTAAFVLPILQRLIATPLDIRKTRAVILAPTRELVEQILAVVRELGVHTNIRAIAVYGGVPMQQQTRALRSGVEIVVACPGRFLDHINRRNTDLRQLDCLVLDEADRMLDMGFLPSIEDIIDALPGRRQTLLFSATFAKALNSFVQHRLSDPMRVVVDNAVPAQTVRHTLYHVKGSMKTQMLTALLRQLIPDSDSVLIFTRTRVTANQVAEDLYAAGMHADVLHAEKTQRERQLTLDRFRSGVLPYLVATDIAARGIDVTSISHVINFDLPEKADDYLHRIGRTGRMERPGHAISLLTRGDGRALRDIERMLGKRIEVAELTGDVDEKAEMRDVIPALRAIRVDTAPPHHQGAFGMVKHPEQPRHHGQERPQHKPRHAPAAPIASAPYPERPEHARRIDAPPQGETATYREDRPRRSPYAKGSPSRHEHPGTSRNEGRSGRPPRQARTDRADRHQRGGEPTAVPAPQARPSGMHFTGMASVAEHRRKYAAGKRQPGEVAAGPRPAAKRAPDHQFTSPRATRAKRTGGRGR